ncbi:MAG: cell division protein FtsA [Bacteroidaceae bacterium]|nr:cell division protein FtsA [Bacteroidaceae bacterium]
MDNDFIVAIELGSSKISGVAGKKKDGTMQILAYAEEKSLGCIKRGVVYNIEKTYQSVNNIIAKLETTLKTKIKYAYVGLGGQSVRSYKCVIKRNLLTQSYITTEAIDAIRQESYEIPYSDYEVLENFPQEYTVDSSSIAEPVGVMGTNIEGEFLDVIAKQKLRANVSTVFANTNLKIADELISPLQLANNVLTDAEKRSGCALVDLGAETTTLVVYKNNIVRYLVTIPLGSSNINKDLATLQIEDAETEDVKLKFGNACQDEETDEMESLTYSTGDGRQLDVALLKSVIEARIAEIVANVGQQIVNSNYSGKLLAGIVLTGGGSNMKNIVKAFTNVTKIEKVRVAKKVNQTVVKTSNAGPIVIESAESISLLSLLLSGTIPCGGGVTAASGNDLFEQQQKDEERRKRQEEMEAQLKEEALKATEFDAVKQNIRNSYDKVQNKIKELERYGRDKEVRRDAKSMADTILDETLGEKYDKAYKALEGKDKFKQSLKEGSELAEKLKQAVEELSEKVVTTNKENSTWERFKRAISDIVNEDNN